MSSFSQMVDVKDFVFAPLTLNKQRLEHKSYLCYPRLMWPEQWRTLLYHIPLRTGCQCWCSCPGHDPEGKPSAFIHKIDIKRGDSVFGPVFYDAGSPSSTTHVHILRPAFRHPHTASHLLLTESVLLAPGCHGSKSNFRALQMVNWHCSLLSRQICWRHRNQYQKVSGAIFVPDGEWNSLTAPSPPTRSGLRHNSLRRRGAVAAAGTFNSLLEFFVFFNCLFLSNCMNDR